MYDANSINIPNTPISKFRNVRQGTLNRFYTHKAVGELLVDQLHGVVPSKILDLGAGEGSLSSSSGKCWNDAEIVTVDIDQDCIFSLSKNIAEAGTKKHIHHIHNVLDINLPLYLNHHGDFDLAVCNPPFYTPEWHDDFLLILQHADMTDACQSKKDINAEILFLAQNLRLVKKGGTIALIVPDGILTGCRNKPLRNYLLSKHRIDCVLQLPRHAFTDTEARCFILILTKNAQQTENVKLLKYNATTGISAPLFITIDEAIQRLDYEYHANKVVDNNFTTTLRQLGAEINRGSISTVTAKNANFPIFHTSDYNNLELGRITFNSIIPMAEKGKRIIAEPGDILMARVDRNLHRKIAMVVDGNAVLTDCVYRVRLPANVREAAFQVLRSNVGSAKLQAASKGVGARLLGKADLLDLPLNIQIN